MCYYKVHYHQYCNPVTSLRHTCALLNSIPLDAIKHGGYKYIQKLFPLVSAECDDDTPIHRKTGSCMKARPKGHRTKTWRTQVISVARLHCATIAQRIEKI